MFSKTELENMLFLDIETARAAESWELLSPRMKELWERKAELLQRGQENQDGPEQSYTERAAIYAEFGKVVCISCGYIRFEGMSPKFRLKSFSGADERMLLEDFSGMLNPYMQAPSRMLCAHNGKEFDFPYLSRRYLIHQLPLPAVLLELQGKKPWEVRVVDTMQLWKFGDYKSYTSLDLLTAVLGIATPKDDMDGSMVGKVFWEDKNYHRIAEYCEKDVLATAQVLLRFSGMSLIRPEHVERSNP